MLDSTLLSALAEVARLEAALRRVEVLAAEWGNHPSRVLQGLAIALCAAIRGEETAADA